MKAIVYRQPKPRRQQKIVARGKFYTTQDLIDRVNELAHQGVGIIRIAELCGVAYTTVKRILRMDPREPRAFPMPDYSAYYVVVTESGMPEDVDPIALELHPKLDKPWVHGSALEDSQVSSMRRKIHEMGDRYGSLRIAKLVFVDHKTLLEPDLVAVNRDDS